MRIGQEMQMTGYPHGVRVFVGIGVILWKYKKKPSIALSTTEAEYMVTSHYTKKMVWFKLFLVDVGYVQERLTSIMCDNQGCKALAKNHIYHSCTKHIDVQHHFIREKLENQDICLKFCLNEDIILDVLTKPFAKDRHQALTKAMGVEAFDYLQSKNVEGRALGCS